MQLSNVTKVDSTESITWRSSDVSLFSDRYKLNSSGSVDLLVGNVTTLTSPYVTQYSDVSEVTSTESITWQSSDISLSSGSYMLNSSDLLHVQVGDKLRLTSPLVTTHSQVMIIDSATSILGTSSNVSLISDLIVVDCAKYIEMQVGNSTFATMPLMTQHSEIIKVNSAERITWRSKDVGLHSTIYKISSSDRMKMEAGNSTAWISPYFKTLSQNTSMISNDSITMTSTSINLVGEVTIGDESSPGHFTLLNRSQSNVSETITANGATGKVASGKLIASFWSFLTKYSLRYWADEKFFSLIFY
jgi:hypothetical protein